MAIYTRLSAKVDEEETEIEIGAESFEVKVKLKGAQFESEAEIKAAIEAAAGCQIPDLFVHLNDDDSIAMATGAEPEIWPEDE